MKAGSVNDLLPGDMNVVKTGEREILIVNTGAGIYALDNFCTHGGCRLVHGTLEREDLHCLCHGSVFRVKTGEVVNGPAPPPQPSYPVIIRDGAITMDL